MVMDASHGEQGNEMAIASAGGALAAFFGAIVPGPVGLMAGAALAPYTILLVQRAAAEWGRKREVVEDAALEAAAPIGPEEFCAILGEDPALIALAQTIAQAASASGNDGKLRGLGTLLGGAVARRGDRLEETQMLAAALADMESPHAVVLDVLTRPAPDSDERRRAATGVQAERPHLFPSRAQNQTVSIAARQVAWLPEQIADEVPMPSGFVPTCLGVLSLHGLAQAVPALDGFQRYMITDLGRALAAAMTPRPREVRTAQERQ